MAGLSTWVLEVEHVPPAPLRTSDDFPYHVPLFNGFVLLGALDFSMHASHAPLLSFVPPSPPSRK